LEGREGVADQAFKTAAGVLAMTNPFVDKKYKSPPEFTKHLWSSQLFQLFLFIVLVIFAAALGVPAFFFLYGTYNMNHPWIGCAETTKGEVYYIGSHTTKGEEVKGVPVSKDGLRLEDQAKMITVDALKVISCPSGTTTAK
jgi:hypothetical protein